LRLRFVFRRETPGTNGVSQTKTRRSIDSSVGKIGERAGCPHHGPNAADIRQRNQQCGFAFHAAQQPHCLGFILAGRYAAAVLT
jgi:hypothetical protein